MMLFCVEWLSASSIRCEWQYFNSRRWNYTAHGATTDLDLYKSHPWTAQQRRKQTWHDPRYKSETIFKPALDRKQRQFFFIYSNSYCWISSVLSKKDVSFKPQHCRGITFDTCSLIFIRPWITALKVKAAHCSAFGPKVKAIWLQGHLELINIHDPVIKDQLSWRVHQY